MNTAAIQKVIDACHDSGGGIVYFPNVFSSQARSNSKGNVTLR